jgi:hypothetical protein
LKLLTVRAGPALEEHPAMLTLLLIVLVLSLLGGGIGHSRYGYYGWSPAAIIIVVLLILALTGRL